MDKNVLSSEKELMYNYWRGYKTPPFCLDMKYESENFTLFQGDSAEVLKTFDDESVDIVITSPPYDDLRNYNGYSFNFEMIAKELFRVMKKGGVVVWVVNDATIKGSETCTSFKQALFFRECGFNLHDTMIWIKDGGGAIGSNKCYTQNFEYMFVFSKGSPKSINLIYDKPNKTVARIHKNTETCRMGRRLKNGIHKQEKRTFREMSKRNNWWYLVPQKQEGSAWHPAVLQKSIVDDHIKSWSNEGDVVLDPFMGSGTVARSCEELGRKCIGIEISEDYCNKIVENFGLDKVEEL